MIPLPRGQSPILAKQEGVFQQKTRRPHSYGLLAKKMKILLHSRYSNVILFKCHEDIGGTQSGGERPPPGSRVPEVICQSSSNYCCPGQKPLFLAQQNKVKKKFTQQWPCITNIGWIRCTWFSPYVENTMVLLPNSEANEPDENESTLISGCGNGPGYKNFTFFANANLPCLFHYEFCFDPTRPVWIYRITPN